LSTSIVALWNSALLLVLLRRRIGGSLGLLPDLWRIAAATIAMGFVCRLWLASLGPAPHGLANDLARVATTVPLGAATFYAVGRALGLADLERLAGSLRRRVWR